MATTMFDARGMKCPQPTLRLSTMNLQLAKGDVMEIVADCSTFESDVRDWCTRNKKIILWMKEEGPGRRCQIQF